MASLKATISSTTPTDVAIGKVATGKSVLIWYSAKRDTLTQTGDMVINCPFLDEIKNYVPHIARFDMVGMTGEAKIVGDDIVLTLTLDDSSVSDVEFRYNATIITGTKTITPS